MAGEYELDAEQRRIKEAFEEEVGYWTPAYDAALRADPEFFDRFRKFAAHPYREGVLEPKVREFLLIAVNASVTHLYNDAVDIHVGRAFDCGATFEEVREVLQRITNWGIHAISIGVPILVEEAGRPETTDEEVLAEQDRIRTEYTENRGYWTDYREDLLQLDHEFLDHYTAMSSYPYTDGPLSYKVKEFIAIANDATATHMYEPGLRQHMRNALDAGATREEVMEVLEVVSAIGIQTQLEAAPILIEQARERGKLPDDW